MIPTKFLIHVASLRQFFSSAVPLPASIVNVGQLSSSLITIQNEDQKKRLQLAYEQLSQLCARTTKMIPKEWPTKLPNLSTHDGLPQLIVGSVVDFSTILAVYSEYTKGLELLKKNWSFSLRILYTSLEEVNEACNS